MAGCNYRFGWVSAEAVVLALASGALFAAANTEPRWSARLPDWDLSGATQELQLVFRVGYAVAEGKDFPHWYPDSEVRATREAMLAQPEEWN